MKDLLLRAPVVVRTSNMKISRRRLADYVKTLHQKACRTCSTIIFLHSTNEIIDLWRCRWRCRRQILNSLMSFWGRKSTNNIRTQRIVSIISFFLHTSDVDLSHTKKMLLKSLVPSTTRHNRGIFVYVSLFYNHFLLFYIIMSRRLLVLIACIATQNQLRVKKKKKDKLLRTETWIASTCEW